MKVKRKIDWEKIIGIILFITLNLSMVYALIRLFLAPDTPVEAYQHVKSDYMLMFVQCLLGLLVMSLPSILERRLQFVLPDTMTILYYLFLYCAIYLGEVRSFYTVVPHWDSILHSFSGAMLAVLGFILVDILNKSENISVQLSPFFVSLFAFSFALMVGALWEIYEFSFDALLGLNMQKTSLKGVQLIGKVAVQDTMKDLILDALSSLAIAVLGYFVQHRKKEYHDSMINYRNY